MKPQSPKDFLPQDRETYIRAKVSWDDYEVAQELAKKHKVSITKYLGSALKFYNFEMKKQKAG